jgi:GABA permease
MRRYLVVANQTVTGADLMGVALARHRASASSFHIVVPATRKHSGALWTEGQACAQAQRQLERALRDMRDQGLEVSGEVGDENPVLAAGDVLRRERFDEVIVSTLPAGISRWLHLDLPARLERISRIPVTHVIQTRNAVEVSQAGGTHDDERSTDLGRHDS